MPKPDYANAPNIIQLLTAKPTSILKDYLLSLVHSFLIDCSSP